MIVLRKIFTKAQDEDFVNDLKEKAEKKIKVDRRLKKAIGTSEGAALGLLPGIGLGAAALKTLEKKVISGKKAKAAYIAAKALPWVATLGGAYLGNRLGNSLAKEKEEKLRKELGDRVLRYNESDDIDKAYLRERLAKHASNNDSRRRDREWGSMEHAKNLK